MRLAGLLALLSSACGADQGILDRVVASCRGEVCAAGSDVSTMVLEVFVLEDGTATRRLRRETISLNSDDAFPYDILLEPEDDTPKWLLQRLSAFRGTVAAAEVEVQHRWRRGHLTRVEFALVIPE